MNKKQLEQEHAHVKKVLAEINNFINSEDYYNLPDKRKTIYNVKKSALETYLKALSTELWDENNGSMDLSALMWTSLLGAAFAPSSFGSKLPSAPAPAEKP